MAYLELDTTLSDEAKAIQDTAKRFAMEVMRPIGEELDKLADPEDVIAKDSKLWEVHRKYRELGFHKMGVSKLFGGMAEDMDPMAGVLVGEAMGYGDSGLAVSLGVSAFPITFAGLSQNPKLHQLVRDYCEDTKAEIVGCWAITEPDHGSDWILAADPAMENPKTAPSCRAVLKGDEYIITGQKSAWVSNGTIATHATLHVALDPSKGMHGTGIAVVPLDLPGITRGKPLNKMGQRPLNQGEIFFEEVKIPKENMVFADPASTLAVVQMILTSANSGMCISFSGLAQAAFDIALDYAKNRVQGGVPIFEHQNIKLKLFSMLRKVEAARAFGRRLYKYNTTNPPGSAMHAIVGKTFSTETATEVAAEAIQVLGGNGLTKEYPIEKIYRDAKASMIEDGENSALALTGASFL